MGKQINYYLGYEPFLELARLAAESGCVIVRCHYDREKQRWSVCQGGPEVVVPDQYSYFFHLPEAGPLAILDTPYGPRVEDGYSATGNAVIEAGFSRLNEGGPTRSRLFVISGYYDGEEVWVPRPDCMTKLYDRLARRVKKLAPYVQPRGWQYKTYASPDLLPLLEQYD
ncbi:MAG: hypothetical protein HFF11_08840 [Angelakisella sp.]|jgi:hypothetical protein|nr:hypothetical protein [Angelakisella sp.]